MRTVFFSLLGIILGISFNYYYSYHLDISNKFYASAVAVSNEWANMLRSQSTSPCNIFTGGSEVRMGINPKIMLEKQGVRSINAAGNAGYGKKANALVALKYLQKGDTLYITIRDVDIFQHSTSNLITTGGLKWCFKHLSFDMFKTRLIDCNISNISQIFCGDSNRLCMYISTLLLDNFNIVDRNKNKPIIHESGWVENHSCIDKIFHRNFHTRTDISIPIELLEFLKILQCECKKKDAKLVIYTNAHYANPKNEIPYLVKITNELIHEGFTVLKVEEFGCESDINYFSDSPDHLSIKGATKWSSLIANAIKNNKYWTKEELQNYQNTKK